ncbi:30S ribosomal protein S20 [Candidatus Kaiserbacteria bacterium RIFCSPHIGHO2_01_FULL_50_13]|uniref:Small ribosomal subunit protein bS20 n=1 Tax=Candidatus Kaiserbacteria bacterium RIFCSPLOWO2_01_FULL_50_24 TaxID=1798507 RepID=A0A1F6ER98_9BACT|nr:MAG: 30S ribosomal protein S20 [Candidatus Kaiserbacteria bacterium RIFCSPHIGHO2_01_FULL_50_13]OGG76145.1 MAG: 30S ribosomal protein S20 [Candidatus Kaiserbacteria bacterium RIFCSPLOWO2_01_FULL_50_24]OGG81178.1 MAG: 30S ribosomal protein S20 [Candidatus Kaiserbacteria bacterium RIFCSPLOWO2_02_FULL_51_13]
MAKTSSAKKAHRASERKAVFNARRKRAMKVAVREFTDAGKKGDATAATLLSEAYGAIDKATKRGVVKKNTAARMKSRLAKYSHAVTA